MQVPDFLNQDSTGYIAVRGHRIGLFDLIAYYQLGDSAEMLHVRFPTLTLAVIHKTIGFYLDHQAEVDTELEQAKADYERRRAEASHRGPSLEELKRRREQKRLAPGA